MKIIDYLESKASDNSKFEIFKSADRIVFKHKRNLIIQGFIFLNSLVVPWVLIYLYAMKLPLYSIVCLSAISIIFIFLFVKIQISTNNTIEFDLVRSEMRVIRKGYLNKLIRSDVVIEIKPTNELLEERIRLVNFLAKRISFKNENIKIPLFDLKYESEFDQIFLSLKHLIKGE